MKKTLVALMTMIFMTIGTAQAATTSSTPITDWLNRTTASVTKAETDTANAIAAQKKAIKEQKAAQKKAEEERKAAFKAQKKQIKDNINQQKSFWKKLFTWDWE